MRKAVPVIILWLSAVVLAVGADPKAAPSATASARPQFRPALLGSGPTSLINQIDSAALLKAGQKDGAVMFSAMVAADGTVSDAQTYRPMPDSKALEDEVATKLAATKLVPAIYNHQPVPVLFYGTAIFSVSEDKPHLRIVLHQDPEELKKESDFIAPQPVLGNGSRFAGLSNVQENQDVPVSGIVDLALTVDAQGNPKEMAVVGEEPPLVGFAEAAMNDFEGAKFIPAFSNGDPAESSTVMPVFYPID
ncbi:MAG: energy transducer TonB [Verrucomicrobiota bacterium]|nr:energy transducer TonB [Verrucomicrobiota bacterium]